MGTYRRRFFALASLLSACLLPSWVQAAEPPVIGDLPPPQLGKDGDGERFDLAQHRGKVVIVTFWASWCGYCLKELPALNALQSQVDKRLLQVVAVNVQDDNAQYRSMTRQMHDYQIALTRDRNGDIAAGYGVKSYPNLWMIDPQGRIASHHVGYGEGSLDPIIDEIKRLLSKELQRQQQAASVNATPAG